MPFTRPTLDTLIAQAAADLASRLPGSDPFLRRSVLGVLGRVHAGGVDGLYGYLDWVSRQIIPDTAELAWLERWASLWGITRKLPSAALGNVTITGTDGTVIPAGTILRRSDQALYSTFAQVTIAAGTASAVVTAAVPGAAGNANAGTSLSFVTPIAGAASTATVDVNALGAGADAETDAQLLARLKLRVSSPPAGGNASDYIAWALEVSGVTKAWVAPQWSGAGTVGLFFLFNGGLPGGATVSAVKAYIDANHTPVTDSLVVLAPTAYNVTPTIHISPDNTTTRAAVTAALAALFTTEATPRGVSLPAGSLPDGTIYLSRFRRAIADATGIIDSTVTVPAADVVAPSGSMPVLGAITWV